MNYSSHCKSKAIVLVFVLLLGRNSTSNVGFFNEVNVNLTKGVFVGGIFMEGQKEAVFSHFEQLNSVTIPSFG